MKLSNIKRTKLLKIQSSLLIAVVAFILLAPVSVFADIKSDVCSGVGLSSGGTCAAAEAESSSVNSIVATGLNLFSAIIGIIAVVMIIIGGVKYMTSQGDAGKTNEAKNTVLYACIGLVVVALAQVIVRFVLSQFT